VCVCVCVCMCVCVCVRACVHACMLAVSTSRRVAFFALVQLYSLHHLCMLVRRLRPLNTLNITLGAASHWAHHMAMLSTLPSQEFSGKNISFVLATCLGIHPEL
jgi:hypothetical protein